jgi:DNA-binding transcriptional regulator YiaG
LAIIAALEDDMSAMADWATDIEVLRNLRQSLQMSQAALASRLGVHPVTVARWETGARRVPEMAMRFVELIARNNVSNAHQQATNV